MNIAIVGLGRVGASFLNQMLVLRSKGVNILAVAESADTVGRKEAEAAKITVKAVEELVAYGPDLDIIFDLSGSPDVRKTLRNGLRDSNNDHTVIAPENVAQLIWTIIENEPLPDVHSHKGY